MARFLRCVYENITVPYIVGLILTNDTVLLGVYQVSVWYCDNVLTKTLLKIYNRWKN